MKLPTSPRALLALVGSALVLSAAASGLATHELTTGSAKQAVVITASTNFGVLQAEAKAHPLPAVVPYVGPFNLHGCGPAIKIMDQALVRKGFRKTKPALCYGLPTKRQVANFQRSINYKPTGHYSLVTHRALVKRHGYTIAMRGELVQLAHIRYVDAYRNAVRRVAAHVALVGGHTLTYSQGPSRQFFPAWPRIPPATDCSGMVIFIEYQSGAGPAVGYFGPGSIVGYTGTLALEGRPVSFRAVLQPGDVVLYGRYPFFHAAIYIGNGLVLSHGRTGVDELPWNYNGEAGSIRRMVSA